MTSFRLYQTQPSACPYIEGRQERRLVYLLSDDPAPQERFGLLTSLGFRRSHDMMYRPACVSCEACVPMRIPVRRFAPSRSQKRILRRNAALEGIEKPAIATDEQYALFARYQKHRHGDGDMARMTARDYEAMVETTSVDTRLVEYREDGTLVAAMLADRTPDGLSAVYSFFSPDLDARSPGTFMVLDLVERCRADGLHHVYLGFFIAGCRKMAYKARFRPVERLATGGWTDLEGAPGAIAEDRRDAL